MCQNNCQACTNQQSTCKHPASDPSPEPVVTEKQMQADQYDVTHKTWDHLDSRMSMIRGPFIWQWWHRR